MELTIQTDREHDLLYVAFASRALRKGAVKKTVRVTDDIALDYDGRGTLVGLEIMNASIVLRSDLSELRVGELVGVKEAAAIAGVRPSNFLRDYADKHDFPRPAVELANGRVWMRSQIEAYVGSRKRRPRLRAS